MRSRETFMRCLVIAGLAILISGLSQDNAAAERAEFRDLRLPVVNVRDFGARGNGISNDTAAIQAAIDSLALRGGTVFFPPGTYRISQAASNPWCLLLRSNIDYVGVGPESKLLLAPGQTDRFTRMMSTISSETSRNISIRGLHFDGNMAAQPFQGNDLEQMHAIFLGAVEDCEVSECLFHDTGGDAVFVHAGRLTVSCQRVRVVNNEMYRLNRVGVNFQNASNSIARANFIHDMTNNSMKIEQDSVTEPAATGNQFIHNFVRNAGGLALSPTGRRGNVNHNLIAGNTFDTTVGPAISLSEVSNVRVSGNIIVRPAGQGVTVRSSDEVTISENKITHTTFGQVFDGVILVHSDASGETLPPSERITIERNELCNNAVTAIKLRQAAGAMVKDNLILNNIGEGGLAGQAAGVDLQGSAHDAVVRDNTIKGGDYAILIREGASANRFRKNDISAHTAGGVWIQSDAGAGNDFDVLTEANANCFRRNAAFGLRNDTAATVGARGNFWGCAAGPGSAGCDEVIGLVSFSPFLSGCPR